MAYTFADGTPWSVQAFQVVNPVIALGVVVAHAGTDRTKTGDGLRPWSALPWDARPVLPRQGVSDADTPDYVAAHAAPVLLPDYAPHTGHTYDARSVLYNAKASNTRRLRAGLGRAGRADYTGAGQFHNELWIGDSIIGGCTGIGPGTPPDTTRFDRLNAVPRFYERALAAATGVAIAGTGLVRFCDGSHLDARFTLAGGAKTASTTIEIPVGGSCTFTSNAPGDQVIVTYYDNFPATTTGFTVAVNGATSGAGFASVVGSATNKYRTVTLTGVAGLVAGSTVKITAPSRTVELCFIEVRSSAGGLSVSNVALSGSSTVGANPSQWNAGTGSGFNAQRQVTDSTALPYVPDVVHLGWGLFDAQNGVSQTAYKAALKAICGYFPASDRVLHALPTPMQLTDAQWLPYLSTVYQVADELDLPVVDVHQLTGGGQALKLLGLTGDSVAHYLPAVYAMWGRATARLVA